MLIAVGCSEKRTVITDAIEGCRFECAVCVDLDMMCIERAEDVDSTSSKEVTNPSAPGIKIVGPQGEMIIKPRKQP